MIIAIDSMPYNSINPQAPFPEDYADYCPLGQCPVHGLEGYRAESRECNTGYDIYLAPIFICGEVDFSDLF